MKTLEHKIKDFVREQGVDVVGPRLLDEMKMA